MDNAIVGIIIVVIAVAIYFVVKKTKYRLFGDSMRRVIDKFKKDQ